jgi:hypothetical protein
MWNGMIAIKIGPSRERDRNAMAGKPRSRPEALNTEFKSLAYLGLWMWSKNDKPF